MMMKMTRMGFIALLVFSLGMAKPILAKEESKPEVKPLVGKLTHVEGSVEIQKFGTQTWIEAKEGMELGSGDQIAAGIDGKAKLEFANSQTDIQPLAQFSVGRNYETKDQYYTEMFLQVGKLVSHVDKREGKANKFTVTTPSSVAGIRGTTLECAYTPGVGAVNTITEGAGYVAPVNPANLPPNIQQILNVPPPPAALQAAAAAAEKAGAPAAVVAQIAAGVPPTAEAREVMAKVAIAGGATPAAAAAIEQGFVSFTALAPSLTIPEGVNVASDVAPIGAAPPPGGAPGFAPPPGAVPAPGVVGEPGPAAGAEPAFGPAPGAPGAGPEAPGMMPAMTGMEAMVAMAGMMPGAGPAGEPGGLPPGMTPEAAAAMMGAFQNMAFGGAGPEAPGGAGDHMQAMGALLASVPGLLEGVGGMPAMMPGMEGPGMMMPGMAPGMAPGMEGAPGMMPGMAPGMAPGMMPGMAPMMPGMAPGMEGPGMMPGMGPGMEFGMFGAAFGPVMDLAAGEGGAFFGAPVPGFEPGFFGGPGDFGPVFGPFFGPNPLLGGDPFAPLFDFFGAFFFDPNMPLIIDPNLVADFIDADGDGLPNDWEIGFGLNPNDPSDANADPDLDGFTNRQEFFGHSDPKNSTSQPPATSNATITSVVYDRSMDNFTISRSDGTNFVRHPGMPINHVVVNFDGTTSNVMGDQRVPPWADPNNDGYINHNSMVIPPESSSVVLQDVDGDGHSNFSGLAGTPYYDPADNVFGNPTPQDPGALPTQSDPNHHTWADNPNPFHH